MAGGIPDEEGHLSNGYDRPSSGYDPVQQEERDCINLEILNTDEEQELQRPPPNGNARGQEENPESRCSSLWSKYRMKILLGIVICVLLIIIFILVAYLSQKCQAVQTETSMPLNFQKNDTTCASDWTGRNGYCYKLSENEKNWKESQNACTLHNASLAKVTEEERGVQGIIRMFTTVHVFWIGLKREPDQPWKWPDGENATIKIMGNGGNCAILDKDVAPMSVSCINKHHYVCKKKKLRDPERELELSSRIDIY